MKILLYGFFLLISVSSYANMICIETNDLTKTEIVERLNADYVDGFLLKSENHEVGFPNVIKYYKEGLGDRNGSLLWLIDEDSESNSIAIYIRPERELRLACLFI